MSLSKLKLRYLSKGEIVKYSIIGAAYYFVLTYLFFRSVSLSLISFSLFYIYLKKMDTRKKKDMDSQLRLEFKEAIYALSSSLGAGTSVERAFIKSYEDLNLVYGQNSYILTYWGELVKKISMNVPLEKCLEEMAEDSDLEEIKNFSSIFSIGKTRGGNLLEIIKNAVMTIGEKIDLNNELDVLIASKKYEQRILSFIIPSMILFFNLFSPTFLLPLYTSLKGRVIMLIAMIAYLMSIKIGEKIVDIRV